MKKLLKFLVETIFILAVVNTLITFGFITTSLFYYYIPFEWSIVWVFLGSVVIWSIIGYNNMKDQLKL